MNEEKEFYQRRLPHYHSLLSTFFITFRLANSLPKEIIFALIEERRRQLAIIDSEKDKTRRGKLEAQEDQRYFGQFDDYLDRASAGSKWLLQENVSEIVANAIRYRDGKDYKLIAFCVMPNHVHLVVEIERTSASLQRILQLLKSFTAVEANKLLQRKGTFWQHESYDHVIRNEQELERIIWYVLENPVKAHLCRHWRDWKGSYVRKEYIDDL